MGGRLPLVLWCVGLWCVGMWGVMVWFLGVWAVVCGDVVCASVVYWGVVHWGVVSRALVCGGVVPRVLGGGVVVFAAWIRSLHLNAPSQRHGQRPFFGKADPSVVK